MSAAGELIGFVQTELARVADPGKVGPMQAYMKTDMPFYGVPMPLRKPISREIKRRFAPGDVAEYRRNVHSLWTLPHREEKYLAIGYAREFRQFVTFDQIDLYRQMIMEGAWWDFVDELAGRIVSHIVLHDRERMQATLEGWIDHEDLWIRRTAILCQLGHKEHTDRLMLFDFCLRRAHEKEFFIRKAIGWALREYAYSDPEAVAGFLSLNRDRLSGLSKRQAGKHLRGV